MAQTTEQLRKNKKSMGIYKTLKERAQDAVTFITKNGPSGCIAMANEFKCSRATMQGVISSNIGTLFKKVREAGNGIYGKEALYGLLTDEDMLEAVKEPAPAGWEFADPVLMEAMQNMMRCRENV